jgi:hypothetical protein
VNIEVDSLYVKKIAIKDLVGYDYIVRVDTLILIVLLVDHCYY